MQVKNSSLFIQKACINGQWVDAYSGKKHTIYNPFDRTVLGTVPDMGQKDVQLAIDAAHSAFFVWKKQTAGHRAILLRKWFNLIIESADELAVLLTLEQGKPLKESKGEILYGASFIEWFAEEAKRVYGDIMPSQESDKRIFVAKEPIGVVGAITPWNFPNAMITRKVAPALAVGCTVVIKPSEDTPFSALALVKLALKAGIPKGVINVVTTANPVPIGIELCNNPKVRKLSFTGSTTVGKLLMKQCADTVKKVSLELGGNAPFIVLKDADIDQAVLGAIASKYRNAGQTCVCTNRFFIHEDIYAVFLNKFSDAVGKLRVGNGLSKDVNIGPLINEKAIKKMNALVEKAISQGARLVQIDSQQSLDKNCMSPMILENVHTQMAIANEEIFGPISTVFKFKTEQEVIQMANDTPFGLASYFYGKDVNKILRLAENLEYGMVGVNTGMISNAVAPFGGVKQSGLGREGSKYGMDDFIELKYICLGGVQ